MDTEADRAAEVQELRLALTAVFATLADRGPQRCEAMIDQASRFASHAPRQILSSIGVTDSAGVRARFGATRTLSSLCGACGGCPRGELAKSERIMAPPAQ